MTNLKWSYVAKGHYSAPEGGWTVHVLDNGAVYKTHPTRATVDVTGSKADRYVESAQTKFPVRGKRRAEPEREPEEERVTPVKVTAKPTPKPTKKVTKKKIGEAAKKLAKGAGVISGTTRAFVSEIGEAEEAAYAKRWEAPPKKRQKPEKKRKKKAIVRRAPRAPEMEHPLEYLMSGAGALPPTGRRAVVKKRREQTLEEFLGF